ncbi:protein trichome birefringence-like 12 [Mangifera indica]|uniref:protein trichome birefringence-like 12 n=1 Tax=Mangifera indica TaxID=29780 RepID=UPI001CFAA25A|nr:protein trichome birefringence-like 12 [Mangifera indica]
MSSNWASTLFHYLVFISIILLYIYSSFLSSPSSKPSSLQPPSVATDNKISSNSTLCNLFKGKWILQNPNTQRPLYDETCPFHRNAWNCFKNRRAHMSIINGQQWVPEQCHLNRIDPERFLGLMRNKNIGFIGDSLNENFIVSLLCVLRSADYGARKWKKKRAWRGGYFPKYNVTVAYHRAVLLARCSRWQPKQSEEIDQDGLKGIYRVDVDTPAVNWASVTNFYDVLVFNTGHWWGYDKFPKETPLVFFQEGKPINPPLEMSDGFKVVLENMVSYIQKKVPGKTLKFWRLQSPRHFYGGEWNQNGSCLLDKPLEEEQLDLWFDPSKNGVNKEARQLNHVIQEALQGTDIEVLDLTHLSEFRADAHPAVWLGKKDAVAMWGQDCMHWCLPGVPDTWVDILSERIRNRLETW